MKTNSSLILGLAMIVLAVLMEVFWINTGAEALGIVSARGAYGIGCAGSVYSAGL